MSKEPTEVICGPGSGKTALAIGKSLKAAITGKSVIVIQFLKGSDRGELEFLENLDSIDVKIFRFERMEPYYNELTEEEKREERTNIQNGMHFARKVIATHECDFLVLDEILGVIEKGIVSREMVLEMLAGKMEAMHIVMTGTKVPQWLAETADSVTTLTTQERQ